jgi:hypothetical protein
MVLCVSVLREAHGERAKRSITGLTRVHGRTSIGGRAGGLRQVAAATAPCRSGILRSGMAKVIRREMHARTRAMTPMYW